MVWIRICRAQNGRERPPKDRRGVIRLLVENQQLVILCDSHAQYAGFQKIYNCHIEGTKNPRRREKECVNVGMRECVNVVIIHFCSYCENIGAFCEIDVWENGCNFAASNEMNKN
jgi:hypothetical protein